MFFELPSLLTTLATVGLLAILIGVTLLILKWRVVLSFLKNLKVRQPHSGNASTDELKAENLTSQKLSVSPEDERTLLLKAHALMNQKLNVSFEGERTLLDELMKLNAKLEQLNALLTQHRTESQRERSALLQAINVFKLEQQEVQRSTWAESLQIFKQQLSTLNDIASNTNFASFGPSQSIPMGHVRDDSLGLPPATVGLPPERHPPSQLPSSLETLKLGEPALDQANQLENFITGNLERINKAAHHGVDGVKTLVAGAGIEVYSPSDVVFILVDRGTKADLAGKAFALPGQLLTRPWVEWFDTQKDLVYRVESTLCPATVRHKGDGNWEVSKKGRVSQL